MATKSELRSSSCGKCTKKVGNVGICCEGSCGRWYHPWCIKLSNADCKKWGDSSEKWRCENCVDGVFANHQAISVTQGELANARSSNDMNTQGRRSRSGRSGGRRTNIRPTNPRAKMPYELWWVVQLLL